MRNCGRRDLTSRMSCDNLQMICPIAVDCINKLIWQTTSYFAFYDKMQQKSNFSDNGKGMYFKCTLY